jgi:hypothetical protein
MSFWLTRVEGIQVKTRVDVVRDLSSTVRIVEVSIFGGKNIEIVPKQGWLLTSRYNGD